jgi:hypothetical protein
MSSRSNSEHGAPIDGTPRPGTTTRKRPKVGDKDPNYNPDKKKKPSPRPEKKETGKKSKPKYNHRDYRGTRGAIEDAEG